MYNPNNNFNPVVSSRSYFSSWRNRALRSILMATVVSALIVQSPFSYAIDRHEMPQIQAAIKSGELKKVGEIADIATNAIPGHISSIELELEYNILAYEVKIIDNSGAKRRMDINAKTGEILAKY